MRIQNIILVIVGVFLFYGCSSHNLKSNEVIKKKNFLKKEKLVDINSHHTIIMKPSPNDKIFIREYTYRASDDDSKNSARTKAIQQMKVILSEEVGTHIESSLRMNTTSSNSEDYQNIRSEIKSLSVAITQVHILKENWNGETFYLKASVRINPKQTLKLLEQSVKAKSSKIDIEKLKNLIKKQKDKFNEINRQITLQEFIEYDSKKNANSDLNLGYLINQKYVCMEIGIIKNGKFQKHQKNNSHQLRFYIDSDNVLHTENKLSLLNEAPQIYANTNNQMTLYVKNNTRYLLTVDNKKSKVSTLMKCITTKYWNVIK